MLLHALLNLQQLIAGSKDNKHMDHIYYSKVAECQESRNSIWRDGSTAFPSHLLKWNNRDNLTAWKVGIRNLKFLKSVGDIFAKTQFIEDKFDIYLYEKYLERWDKSRYVSLQKVFTSTMIYNESALSPRPQCHNNHFGTTESNTHTAPNSTQRKQIMHFFKKDCHSYFFHGLNTEIQ